MERRSFLKGVFGGVTAAGLVVVATPEEIAAFAAPLVRAAPIVIDTPPALLPSRRGQHLYNERHELVAVVVAATCRIEPIEATMAFDNQRVFLPGRRFLEIRAEGVGPWVTTDELRAPVTDETEAR